MEILEAAGRPEQNQLEAFDMNSGLLFGHYLTPEALKGLHKYHYRSGTWTPVDKLLNYWWELAIKLAPCSMAPNVLTLLGFCSSLFGALLVLIYNPSLSVPMPRWACFAMCASILLYQTLDAIDGKQARRLGVSSPLGQVFDHGCDTFTTMFVPYMALGAVSLDSIPCAIAVLSSLQAQLFLFCWWDLNFHVFPHSSGGLTGVTEGQIVVAAVCFACGWFGPEAFASRLAVPPFLQKYFTFLGTHVIISAAIAVFVLFVLWGSVVVDGIKSVRAAKTKHSLHQIYACAAHLVFQTIFCMSGAMRSYPGMSFVLMTLASSTVALRMELAAIGKMEYSAIQWPVYPFALCGLVLSLAAVPGQAFVKDIKELQFLVLLGLLAWHALYLYELVTTSISDICRELQVNCFRIDTSVQKKTE